MHIALGYKTGDVTFNGTLVVSYLYDAWGYAESCTGTMAATLGKWNPLRYRSYVYDEETEWYYLQSRYYNPEVGRFINADAFASTGQGLTGTNMFAYCGNNPVMRLDPTGDIWISIFNSIYKINNWVHENYNKKLRVSGYIYNQNTGVASQYWFGFFQSSHNGCGWIATYNALIMLGNPQQPYKIISYYEKSGALLYAAAGINPYAVSHYFMSKGYSVTVTSNTTKFDNQAKNNTANILFYWHSNGGHNIAVYWNGYQFVGYNVYSDSTGKEYLGTSLSAFLRKKGYWGGVLTSVS